MASLQQMSSYQTENLTERQWHFYQHKKKKNWNRPNESATRWRVLKLFDQGGILGFGAIRCIVFVRSFYTSLLSAAVVFSVSIFLASGTLQNCMFPCLCHYYLPSPRCMDYPCYRGPICIEVLHLRGVYESLLVFIHLITGCSEIHKLIRWIFMNSMYYTVYKI